MYRGVCVKTGAVNVHARRADRERDHERVRQAARVRSRNTRADRTRAARDRGPRLESKLKSLSGMPI